MFHHQRGHYPQAFFDARRDFRHKQALASSLFFKVHRIHANRTNLHRWLLDGRERAKKKNIKLANATMPVTNLVSEVHFSSDEKALVAGFHDPDLLNAVLNSDHLHNTFLPLPRAYSESRNELSKALTIQGYDQTEAVVDLGRMTMNQQVSVIELNQLLEEMFVISLKDLHDLDFALRALVIQLKRHCRVAISLDFPEQLIARHRTQSDTTQETPSRYRTG